LAYNRFRMTAVVHGIGKRAQKDSAAAENQLKACPLVELAWEFARRQPGSTEPATASWHVA
jgi:hypothetical protein